MTGHETGSHKKRMETRKEVTSEEREKKKLRSSEPPVPVTTVPVVTQPSQADTEEPTASNGIDDVSRVLTGSPLADHDAIAAMSAGAPTNDLPSLSEGMVYGQGRLELFKDRTGKKKAAKLSEVSVFTHIRQGFIKDLASDLSASRRPPASSSHSVRKAVSSFDTITYKRQTKVQPGKSRRLAEQQKKKKSVLTNTVSPEIIRQADEPVFDIKKASKIVPGVDWNELVPTYNLDSHKMRRYVVEDVMYADPEKHERLLLLVSEDHIAIDTTWLPIYRAQNASRVPIMFEKKLFFQIEAEVVKNAKRDDYTNGLVTEDEVTYHLSYEGGAGVCLHFPNCPKTLDIELKFASILCEVKTL
jgi:hypothetical protein